MNPSYSITSKVITAIFEDGRPLTISSSNKAQYEEAKRAIKLSNWKAFREAFNVQKSLEKLALKFAVKIVDGRCYLGDKEINNVVTRKIYEVWQEGLPVKGLVKFLENCLANPSQKAVEELYLFLEKNGFTLTEDGCFIAWRRVDSNYMSYHANPDGTHNRNMPGDKPSMKREDCNSNRDETCSRGLHFCAYDYLSSYHADDEGSKVVLVKINPKNVVSIPSDYKNAKGRCCEYEVLQEVNPVKGLGLNYNTNVLENQKLLKTEGVKVKSYSNRDSKGRFQKLVPTPSNKPARDKNGRFISKSSKV
jgi:hypothetical protein